MRLTALLLAARAASAAGQINPAAGAFGADLVAYYAFDDGTGFDLKEAVTGQLDGKVLANPGDQPAGFTYDQPNWQTDERFGTVISCGSATTLQKDTLELADVDYGKNGAFTMNVWFRHDKENFADLHKEILFGHGDPALSAGGSPNMLHVWLELGYEAGRPVTENPIWKDYNTIRTLMGDSNDPPSYTCPFCESLGLSESDTYGAQTCGEHTNCWGGPRVQVESLPSEHAAYDADADWHMYTVTTHPEGGKGFSVYVDGTLIGSDPYNGKGIDGFDYDTRAGQPFCTDCTELHDYWKPIYQDKTTKDNCVDDDETFSPAMLEFQQLGPLPVPGACAYVASNLPTYCFNPSIMAHCCASCGPLNGYNSSWTPVRGVPGATTAEREFWARGGDPIDPLGTMRFCGRLTGFHSGDLYTPDTVSSWKDITDNAGWHKNRYFLGKLAHASFYSTAMSQTQVQALYQSYLDQYFKFCSNDMTTVCSLDTDCTAPATCVRKPTASDGARAVALGSLAALATGLAALIL